MAGEKIRLVISTHDIWEPLQFDPCSAIQESISAAKQIILRKGYVLIGQGSKTAGFETQLTVSSLEGLAKWEERINEIVLKKGRLP
ncbi:MAG TPA: hypothetical protein VJ385_22225 [Fibrobacteria bacterium]|nr:hypothetical protein [Fibrobacteria bacterium]